jgi:hypothetical protein
MASTPDYTGEVSVKDNQLYVGGTPVPGIECSPAGSATYNLAFARGSNLQKAAGHQLSINGADLQEIRRWAPFLMVLAWNVSQPAGTQQGFSGR